MENMFQYSSGKMIGGNYWGGYGKDYQRSHHFAWKFEETEDGWHYYGVDWSPDGYRFYADRKLIGTVVPPEKAHLAHMVNDTERTYLLQEGCVSVGPVSETEQFILISTECHGYREKGKYDPLLDKAVLPDYFEIDHVRVFDRI